MANNKFKVWDTDSKMMSRVGNFEITCRRTITADIKNGGHKVIIDNLILLDYIGYKDITLQEMCEGDILEWQGEGFPHPQFKVIEIEKIDGVCEIQYPKRWKIVGNKYEHPKLFKKLVEKKEKTSIFNT